MRVSKVPSIQPTEIDGIAHGDLESRFRPGLFGEVARLVYGKKADAKLADIARRHGVLKKGSDRTARFWISGEVAPPACIAADMHYQIFRRA